MNKSFDDKIDSITRFDKIRVHKLAELSQYSVLACLIAIKVGNIVNKIIPKYSPHESMAETYLYMIINVIIIIVSMYYIRKLVLLIPYFFSFDPDYEISRNDESLLGFSIGFGIVFTTTQTEFQKRILPVMTGDDLESEEALQDRLNKVQKDLDIYQNEFKNYKKNQQNKEKLLQIKKEAF